MFLLDRLNAKFQKPEKSATLAGRDAAIEPSEPHFVNGRSLLPPYPETCEEIVLGMGCFWGVERLFWQADGVYVTAVGYAAGHTPNPTYHEVCTGMTGHNEVVRVVYDTTKTDIADILKLFWENHDPTQGMRQGNDIGTQYRSGIYTTSEEQRQAAIASRDAYGEALAKRGMGKVTTEIEDAGPFYFAEDYHQQYLAKNPGGYCNLKGVGVACTVPQPAG